MKIRNRKDPEKDNYHEQEDEEEVEGDILDEFENDGFIVFDEEEEESTQHGKDEKKKKNRKRKSLKNLLDNDDLELLRDNKLSGLFQSDSSGSDKYKRLKKAERGTKLAGGSRFSADDELLYDDSAEEEVASSDGEDEMADFIVDGEGYEKGATIRHWKLKEKKSNQVTVASSPQKKDGYTRGTVDELLKHHLVKIAKPDDCVEFELENYMNQRDNFMKEADVPERMQMLEEIVGNAPADDMRREESSWILNQIITNTCLLLGKIKDQEESEEKADLLKKINKEDIVQFLELRRKEKFDIPFIAMYRKEKCLSLLEDLEQGGMGHDYDEDTASKSRLKWHKVLWAINELDKKWLLLQKRKNSLLMYYNKRVEEELHNINEVARLFLVKEHFKAIVNSLKLAETERNIDDVEMKFNLHFPPAEYGIEGKFKRPKKRSQYWDCSRAGLWKFAGKFGHSSEQFGLQLTLGKAGMKFWENPAESPESMASNFTCAMFETREVVLKGARHMASVEISCEPYVRNHVRPIFMDKAVVSTRPTPEGEKAIDSIHQFSMIKWLHEKPLDKFQDAQWLLIQKAEEEKLLNVVIKLPESILNKFINDSHEIYLTGGDESALVWDEQRKLIIQDAISKFLLPSLEKEIRFLLTARAKNWLLIEYGKQLWNRVSVAPYQCKDNIGLEEGVAPRVMACCWGPGKPPTTFVMLNSSGELLDVLQAGSLCLRSQNVIDQQRKRNDQQRLRKFVRNHSPHVVVLGAVNVSCTWLKDDIKEIIVDENPLGTNQADTIDVFYGDESLPMLYENSKVASYELPGQEGIVKRAVALGRYLQNPLAMIATLCGDQKEILSWKLHSLDHFLTAQEKYEMIEMVMVDVTNQVGIDVNLAVNSDWLSSPLQFVSGLGPRKAAFLKRDLGGRIVASRKELAGCGLRTKKIFCNAVGFVRVCGSKLPYSGIEFEPLDEMRIHPESYSLVESFARAIHGEVDQAQPIEYVKNNLQLLKDFDIDGYADKYEIEKGVNRRQTLLDIKMELLFPFLDPRVPYRILTQDEEFFLISGQKEEAFAEGRTVKAVARHVLSEQAFCSLEFGLTGVVTKEDYLDETDDFSMTDKLHVGDILTCKIKHVDKSRFLVYLSCRKSELKNCNYQSLNKIEPYCCIGQSSSSGQQENASEELAKKHFKPRTIFHSHFKNMTENEAMKFLSDKDVGEYIFHPSARGPCYVTLTLKVCDDLYVHKDIIESGKDQSNLRTLLKLGKTLKIGDNSFEGLDEVICQYVDPLVVHLKAMLSFRKFRRGSKAEVDELLRAEKSEFPARTVYCVAVSYEHPGTFVLSYIRTNLHHEYIGLHPKGFKFRKHMFGQVEQLLAFFQKHIDDIRHNLAWVGGSWGEHEGKGSGTDGIRDSFISAGSNRGGRSRGRGRYGAGNGCGRGQFSSIDGDYSHQETFSGRWNGSGNNADGGGVWRDGGDDNTGTQFGSIKSSGGNWSGSEGNNGRGSGSWGAQEGWTSGNQGDDNAHGRGRGRGRGRGCGRRNGRGRGNGHGRDYDDRKCDNSSGNDFGHDDSTWATNSRDSGRDDRLGSFAGRNDDCANWGRSTSGSWGGNNTDGANPSGGSWSGNEGNGRGRSGNWGGQEEGWTGGDQGEHNAHGHGSGRGHGHGHGHGHGYNDRKGDNNYSKNDFGQDDGVDSFAGGNTNCGNWGRKTSGSWGGNNTSSTPACASWDSSLSGSGEATNAGGSNCSGIGKDSRGILGSGPASGTSWMTGFGDSGKDKDSKASSWGGPAGGGSSKGSSWGGDKGAVDAGGSTWGGAGKSSWGNMGNGPAKGSTWGTAPGKNGKGSSGWGE